MSECVVRMEMPKSCYECEMRGERGFCPIGKLCVVGYRKQRHEDCPIICQLPEGHGRLVDADKLADDMKARKAFFGRLSDPQCLVEDAPTIIPAERRKA